MSDFQLTINSNELFLNDGQDVILTHHEQFLAVDFDFVAGILAIEDGVTGLDDHFLVLGAIACSTHFALERFFLSTVGDDNAADNFFCLCRFNENAVV